MAFQISAPILALAVSLIAGVNLGFIEGHGHFMGFGRGWHQEKWDRVPENAVDGVPRNDCLNNVAPLNPVYLGHASGHAAFANHAALQAAGIDDETPDPGGGTIVRAADGTATGLLRENARVWAQEKADGKALRWRVEHAQHIHPTDVPLESTVLSQDILTIAEADIPATVVDYTFVGGAMGYAR